jgi:hypothetical protein
VVGHRVVAAFRPTLYPGRQVDEVVSRPGSRQLRREAQISIVVSTTYGNRGYFTLYASGMQAIKDNSIPTIG